MSKRKRAEQGRKNRSNWLIPVIILVVVLMVFILLPTKRDRNKPATAIPTKPQETTFQFSADEAKKLVNDLLAASNPNDPQNYYFTPFMKEKIQWIWNEHAAGRLRLDAIGEYYKTKAGQENKATLMNSSYVSKNNDGKPSYQPAIFIYTPRLLMLVRVQQKVQTGFNQMSKNIFVLGLVHEATHFERGEAYYTTETPTDETQLLEEERVWLKVDELAVKQLRVIGQPLDIDFLEVDDILRRCNYQRGCVEFLNYLRTGGKTPRSPTVYRQPQ